MGAKNKMTEHFQFAMKKKLFAYDDSWPLQTLVKARVV